MRKKSILLPFLIVLIIVSTGLFTQETTGETGRKTTTLNFNVGLNFSYNTASIEIGDDKMENSLNYAYLALEVDVDLMDYLTVGILAGMNQNKFKDPVSFFQLPLSLAFDNEKYNSMVLGLTAKSDFLSFGDFSVQARGQYLYFKQFNKETDITLPIVTGTAVSKNTFSQVSLELLGHYDGFSTFTLFAGPQLNLISGEYTAEETIEAISGEETLSYEQKNSFGVVGGINFDLGNHFTVDVRAALISKTALSAAIFYIF